MASTDSAYRSNSKYLSNTNIGGACTGRTKPRYLGSAGTYGSVSYKWGGFNTVAQFNNAMDPQTGKAGDINDDSGTLSCAYGVDCSGFVSRVWQLTSKHSTYDLPNISTATSVSLMRRYDLFNKASHAMLYRSKTSTGFYVSESTTANSLDRVVYRHVTTSYANGFTPRRYNNVCCEPDEQCPV
jgi:hypothetical protein